MVNPKPDAKPRNPQVISGGIRELIEQLIRRNAGMSDLEVNNADDLYRIEALLAELDSSLTAIQLEASLARLK